MKYALYEWLKFDTKYKVLIDLKLIIFVYPLYYKYLKLPKGFHVKFWLD